MIILGIGFIIVGVVGGLGVGLGWLRPIVQNEQVTQLIGSTVAAVICIIVAVALVVIGSLMLAGVI